MVLKLSVDVLNGSQLKLKKSCVFKNPKSSKMFIFLYTSKGAIYISNIWIFIRQTALH